MGQKACIACTRALAGSTRSAMAMRTHHLLATLAHPTVPRDGADVL